MSENNFDAVVIGGGIVGTTAAYFICRKGMKVALVEKETLAGGTSKTANESYHRLNARGLAAYCEMAVEFGEEAMGLNPCGSLNVVRSSDSAAHAAAKEQARALSDFGYPATWIGTGDLRIMEPHLNLPNDAEALFAMADNCLNAPHFVNFMAQQIRNQGGSVFENCAALSLQAEDDGQVSGLETAQGKLSTEHVVVAAGPGTPEVLSALTGYDGFAARFPMHRVPGLLVRTPATAPRRLIRHVTYLSTGTEIHMLPDFNGGLKIGADDTDGMVDAESAPEHLHNVAGILLDRTKDLLPEFAGRDCLDECEMTVGVRPYPKDGHSLAGPLPGAQGLYVIATHSGITLAPAIGGLMADLIDSGTVPEMLAPFTLDRVEGF